MDRFVIGIIRTSHGVEGFLKVKTLSGETDHFYRLKNVFLKKEGKEKTFDVEKVKPFGGDVLLKVKGIDNPEEAKLFSNWEILVDRKDAAPLAEGEYYNSDLCACSLIRNSEVLGKVVSVIEGGAGDLLEIETTNGKVILIPFINEWIGTVDLQKKEIELKEGWDLE